MPPVTSRLSRRIERDFGPDMAETITHVVARAAPSERVQAAIVIAAHGDPREAARQAELAQVDWRDVLVYAGLAGVDWSSTLDEQLGQ